MQTSRTASSTVWTATGRERPIFLDEHGRRRRWVLLAGAVVASASALWLAALVAGAIGFSTLPRVGAVRVGAAAGRLPIELTETHVARPRARARLIAQR